MERCSDAISDSDYKREPFAILLEAAVNCTAIPIHEEYLALKYLLPASSFKVFHAFMKTELLQNLKRSQADQNQKLKETSKRDVA